MTEGQPNASAKSHDEAKRRARNLGFDYIPNSDLNGLPYDKRLARLEALVTKGFLGDAGTCQALLGTAPGPGSFNLWRHFEEYETAINDEVKDRSPDQLGIWRNGRIRSVA